MLAAPGDCDGCDEAAANPCAWCGYGHAFTTHNPEAHIDADNPDPVLLRAMDISGLDCFDAFDRYFNTAAPYLEARNHTPPSA